MANISPTSIVFIQDTNEIWTHNTFFGGNSSGGSGGSSATFYPIGSIYLSMSDINPALVLGFGIWEQIKDTFLIAAGNKYVGGSVGGEETHTLTVEEMPSHAHTYEDSQLNRDDDNPTGEVAYGLSNKTVEMNRYITSYVGSGEPHNNIPPYLAVYMWYRTA